MHRVIRSVAAGLAFVALQLSLLGAGLLCPQLAAAKGATGDSAMTAMDMTAASSSSGAAHDCSGSGHDSRAPHSDAPHCDTMIVCTFAVIAPLTTHIAAATTIPGRVAAISISTPASASAAPELPPPRV